MAFEQLWSGQVTGARRARHHSDGTLNRVNGRHMLLLMF